jgi:hypothetical protein
VTLGRRHLQGIDWDWYLRYCAECALLRIVPIDACAHVIVTSHCAIIVTGIMILYNLPRGDK